MDEDSDLWVDHDERCDGEIDSNAIRRQNPEGFVWSCCGEKGRDSDGCARGAGSSIEEMYATSPEPSVDGSDAEHHRPGELEVDYDEWPDHDEDCHGPIDTKMNRRENPEGFRWSCCDALGTYAQGCEDGTES